VPQFSLAFPQFRANGCFAITLLKTAACCMRGAMLRKSKSLRRRYIMMSLNEEVDKVNIFMGETEEEGALWPILRKC